MLTQVETILRRFRRTLSRSEWLGRLLKLPLSAEPDSTAGLVMVQIDGLSHHELERAIEQGEMPFLKHLIKRENYQLHSLYSGIPSTTPAAQGELFYGIKTAVPSFNFKPRNSEDLVRMFEPAAADNVEKKLSAMQTAPLLKDGSCYADNFTGGAAEAHFCPSSLGWGKTLQGARPLVLLLLVASHLFSFIRTLALMLLEIVLAVVDFTRGLVSGRDLWAELKFIPSRVLIVILLRELTTIGVKIDVARGLPIIHVNFLGYDEQAHRRNPKSLFAHWTLRGIDNAIARIWRATLQASRRSYDLWIYSDHGQQEVVPYEKIFSTSFAQAATNIFSRELGCPVDCITAGRKGIQLERIRMFGGRRTQKIFAELLANISNGKYPSPGDNRPQLRIATLGPVAHLYFNQALAAHQLSALAHALCTEAHVPVVLYCNASGQVRVCRQHSEYNLKENPSALFGSDYPYPDMAYEDIQRLCQHPDAGVLIASGQFIKPPEHEDYQAVSFAVETGTHGGWSRQQTDAFALLPEDIYLGKTTSEGSRLMDIRDAALEFMHPEKVTVKSRNNIDEQDKTLSHPSAETSNQRETMLRIMTYNVHSCIGMDGKLAPERIARVIARYSPDIVALQELDVNRLRTQELDQADAIARYLGMQMHFHSPMQLQKERFGDAILTAFPIRLIKASNLPSPSYKPNSEPRGALWVAIDIFGQEIQLINTHLSLRSQERRTEVQSLLGDKWLGHPECHQPTILCGDFNARPGTPEWQKLNCRLPDGQVTLADHRPKKTFFSRLPITRIDHVFMDKSIEPLAIYTPNNALARVASDHLPLIMDIRLKLAGKQ